jgi:hypothetical protein
LARVLFYCGNNINGGHSNPFSSDIPGEYRFLSLGVAVEFLIVQDLVKFERLHAWIRKLLGSEPLEVLRAATAGLHGRHVVFGDLGIHFSVLIIHRLCRSHHLSMGQSLTTREVVPQFVVGELVVVHVQLRNARLLLLHFQGLKRHLRVLQHPLALWGLELPRENALGLFLLL